MGGDLEMMKKNKTGFFQNFRLSYMIKEALDNLPSGVCYFDGRGIPLLINKTMYELMYRITGRDLQSLSDFYEALFLDVTVSQDDGTVWQFRRKSIGKDRPFTEITASDVTETYRRKCELENSTLEQQNLMCRLEEVGRSIVSITRNEEILAFKMRIHNELGAALAETRQFIHSDYDPDRKRKYIASHRQVAGKLLGEIDQDDEIDIFSELLTNAEKLGAEIVFTGNLPKSIEGLMTQIARECLINAIRHGNGDKIFIRAQTDEETFTAVVTNNGNPPGTKITESGGLLSVRRSVEAMGGSMMLESEPDLVITITLPLCILEESI